MDRDYLAQIIETVRIAPLRPGDVVVVRLAMRSVSDELSARIAEVLRPFFGDNKILVTAQDADIEIVRPEGPKDEAHDAHVRDVVSDSIRRGGTLRKLR